MSSSLMQWKSEPLSPQNSSEESWISDEDVAFYWSALEQNDGIDNDLEILESKAEIASKLLENLDNLNDLEDLIKEEPFANWLEDKVIPIFDNGIQPSPPVINPIHQIKLEQRSSTSPSSTSAPQSDTQALLQEFENIFDAVEMNHITLTPPHSPKYNSNIVTLTPVQEKLNYTPPLGLEQAPPLLQITYQNESPTPQLDVDHELAVVEELVRTRVQDMVHSPLSPSSSSSNFGDCSSDDPEWIPDLTGPQIVPFAIKSREGRRQKPYARATNEDRKSRKKEQNKNAATRYRMKKKAEIEEILEEERQLTQKNDELDNKITDLKREINYLKGLMRDLFKAKGVL